MTNPTYSRTLECALYYISQAWEVLPLYTIVNGKCSCGKANCNSPGKHPATTSGTKDASIDPAQIHKWFDTEQYNIGICAGKESGLVILDIDPSHGGDESLAQLEAKHGALPDTLICLTGGGGRHYYFSHPGGEVRNSAGTLGKGLDVRGHHGYVVTPPSNHASGGIYRWKIDPRAIEITDCPDWILNGKAKPKRSKKAISELEKIEEGERNATLTSMAGTMRRREMSEGAILAALLEENRSSCKPPLEKAEVEQIAASVAKYPAGDSEDSAGKAAKGKTQATILVELANGAELFHDSEGYAFATIAFKDHKETWTIKCRGFRQWIAGQFWQAYHKAPGAQAIQNALAVLKYKAVFEGPQEKVNVRLAEQEDAIYLDLGNENWEAVRITPAGWEVVANPPVKFLHPRGLLPLPHPSDHERPHRLQEFLNLSDYNDWALLLSWMVAALKPTGPYPVLVVNGEQGSAKSTLCRLLKLIIDPNSAPLRAAPRDVRDLIIAASNSWILAFDNLSHIPPWLSDAMCRLATGGGFATRELYSDGEEMIFDVMRPVIVNGIAELATRSDLLDRTICLTLPPIPDSKRKTEEELGREFNKLLPEILGALLDSVCSAMKKLPTVKLESLPRMADFATWSVAAEESLGLIHGAFITAYTANRESATDLAIEVSPIGPAIQGFMEDQEDQSSWEGAAQELLDHLEKNYCSERDKTRRDWPKTPHAFGKALRRIAPNLRRSGIDVKFDRGTGKKRKRLIHLEQIDILTSDPSELSETTLNNTQINNTSDMLDVSDKKKQSNSCCEANLIGEVRTDD